MNLGSFSSLRSTMARFSLSCLFALSAAITALGSIIHDRQDVNIARPIVDLGYARYQGSILAPNLTSFLSIRHATPPTGEIDNFALTCLCTY